MIFIKLTLTDVSICSFSIVIWGVLTQKKPFSGKQINICLMDQTKVLLKCVYAHPDETSLQNAQASSLPIIHLF